MFYLIMVIWAVTSIAALVMLVLWAASKSLKRNGSKKGKATIYLSVLSVTLLATALTINSNDSNIALSGSSGDTNIEENETRIIKTDIHDFMIFEIGYYDITNTIISNERDFEEVIVNLDGYNALDAYDRIKNYKSTLMPNSSVVNGLDVSESLPKEVKSEITEIKKYLTTALANESAALDNLLKYINEGSIEELSSFKDSFLFTKEYIGEQKVKLSEIRRDLKIPKPSYEIIYQPKGTKAFYVQSTDTSNESIFRIIHDIKTTVDSGMSILWVYNSDAEVIAGKRPGEDIDYVVEYISDTEEINYINGDKTTLTGLFK